LDQVLTISHKVVGTFVCMDSNPFLNNDEPPRGFSSIMMSGGKGQNPHLCS
jgi:hypothetical protein